MQILESFTLPKNADAPDTNEDIRGVIGDDDTIRFVYLGDGATSSHPFEGRAGGLVAGERLIETLTNLPFDADIFDFADAATDNMRDMAATWDGHSRYRACIQALVYSVHHKQIWRIGDCHFRVDGQIYLGSKYIDTLANEFRSACITAFLNMNDQFSEWDLMDENLMPLRPWRAIPEMYQGQFQNMEKDDPRAYGTLDGTEIPQRFLQCYQVPEARTITFCSDGFFTPPDSWNDGMADLKRERAINPLMIRKHKGNRPFQQDRAIFDDTTLISFQP